MRTDLDLLAPAAVAGAAASDDGWLFLGADADRPHRITYKRLTRT